jgi:hypothetical protein
LAISIGLAEIILASGGDLSSDYAFLHPPPFFGWLRFRLRPIGEDYIDNGV